MWAAIDEIRTCSLMRRRSKLCPLCGCGVHYRFQVGLRIRAEQNPCEWVDSNSGEACQQLLAVLEFILKELLAVPRLAACKRILNEPFT